MTHRDDTMAAEARSAHGIAGRLLGGLSGLRKRRTGMLFHPAGNMSPEAATGHWRSAGFDSYFYIPMRCEAGLLRVNFDATLCDAGLDHRDRWRLYFDIGEGFRDEDCLVVNCSGIRIEIETTISLPAPALAFRVDPCEEGGRFALHKLELTPLVASPPPSEDILQQLAQLHGWSRLLQKMTAAIRLAQRGRRHRPREGRRTSAPPAARNVELGRPALPSAITRVCAGVMRAPEQKLCFGPGLKIRNEELLQLSNTFPIKALKRKPTPIRKSQQELRN